MFRKVENFVKMGRETEKGGVDNKTLAAASKIFPILPWEAKKR